jgi:cobalt-zinc-cadmium efflux system outer membrane protein
MLLTPRTSRRCLRGMLPVALGRLLAVEPARAQERLTRLTLEDQRAAEAARQKAGADDALARANAWWDVTPQIEDQYIGADNTIGFGISLPLRIFDRNQGEIARTRAEAQRVDAAREAVAVQVLSEADTALAALRSERQKVNRLRDVYLPKARQARDTVEFAYRRGAINLLDFLEAQRAYRDTTSEYVRSLGGGRTSFYQLEAAVGGSLGEN